MPSAVDSALVLQEKQGDVFSICRTNIYQNKYLNLYISCYAKIWKHQLIFLYCNWNEYSTFLNNIKSQINYFILFSNPCV